eukprot:366553-Lingulodinium_polyedra.AAC.1
MMRQSCDKTDNYTTIKQFMVEYSKWNMEESINNMRTIPVTDTIHGMLGGVVYCEGLPDGTINSDRHFQLKQEYDERMENYLK